jgi:diacylglycerol kinase
MFPDWKKLIRSFYFAISGLFIAWKEENNMKFHLIATVIVIIAGVYFHLSLNEWLFVLLSIALVICFELLNTVVEELVDIVFPGYHEKAKKIKDISAGVVLLASLISAIGGSIIFLPKIIDLIKKAA